MFILNFSLKDVEYCDLNNHTDCFAYDFEAQFYNIFEIDFLLVS